MGKIKNLVVLNCVILTVTNLMPGGDTITIVKTFVEGSNYENLGPVIYYFFRAHGILINNDIELGVRDEDVDDIVKALFSVVSDEVKR